MSIQRIENFLELEEIEPRSIDYEIDMNDPYAIHIKNGEFQWRECDGEYNTG